MKRIGVIAALPGELKPLVQGWKPLRARQGEAAWQGVIDGATCIAVCAGMGKEAAERACAIAAQGCSAGCPGLHGLGRSPFLRHAAWQRLCVERSSGCRHRGEVCHQFSSTRGKRGGAQVGHHRPCGPARRKARAWGRNTRPFWWIWRRPRWPGLLAARGSRSIASRRFRMRRGERLPDFSRYTDSQGQLQLAALLAHVAIRPRYWPGLARVGRNGRTGAVAMAAALGPLMGGG